MTGTRTAARPSSPASSARTTATPATPTRTSGSCASTPRPTTRSDTVGHVDDRDRPGAPPSSGTRPQARREERLAQRAGLGARADRHHRLHDGLRHHRHRARPGAGQVQEAGRRRLDADRQPDGAAGAAQPRLPRSRSRRSSSTSPSTATSSTRPASSPSTTRSSTARWASARSPDGPRPDDGAVQPFLSGAISKTVNMPETATVEEIEEIYFQGWKLGLKALAIYRDNCKVGQPLSAPSRRRPVAEAARPRRSSRRSSSTARSASACRRSARRRRCRSRSAAPRAT
jgi:hypothetical protein